MLVQPCGPPSPARTAETVDGTSACCGTVAAGGGDSEVITAASAVSLCPLGKHGWYHVIGTGMPNYPPAWKRLASAVLAGKLPRGSAPLAPFVRCQFASELSTGIRSQAAGVRR